MKSAILISRIIRVIETEGAIGDGAVLADEYSSAVRSVNSRLEAVQTAIDAKQVSDAVRLMEDSPRLLDEIGTLDFNQLPDWEVICSRNRWSPPQKLDKGLLERVLMFNESTDVVEPFLRMYRKAVRTNNNQLAIQSLRRLVQIDQSQNWKVNLLQAEEVLQKNMASDFRVAKSSGNIEEADRIAQEFFETNWSEPPTSKGIAEIRSYIDEKEANRRNVEGAENMSILRRCMDSDWNRQLAYTMLQAIESLVEKGLVISSDDRVIVDLCRKRCNEEIEAERKELRWKDLCEQLHAAIQQEDAAAIRDVLSAPEFLDREPDPELINHARLVIQHEDAARRRKMMQITVCILTVLFAILSLSGWWLRKKLFNDRCEGEAIKLASLQDGAHAVDRLTEALLRLQNDDPEVYADPRVNVFEAKLKTMRSQMIARTNEIASVLAELAALRNANWGDSVDSVTSRIERVNAIIAKDDDVLRSEFLLLKAQWAEHCGEVDTENRNAATEFQGRLVPQVREIAERLRTELISDQLAKEVASCKALISQWRSEYEQYAPSLDGEVGEAEKMLAEAENHQNNLKDAIAKLKAVKTAEEYLMARKTLVEFYSSYPFVKDIGEHPITPADAAAIVSNSSVEQKSYSDSLKTGVDDAEFKTFLADNVASLAEIPSYYSLYGIAMNGGARQYYIAMCKGKPQIKKPSYASTYQIDGELLDFAKGEMVQQMSRNSNYSKPFYRSLPSSDEVKGLVDLSARSNLTLLKFEQEMLKLITEHLKVAGEKDYLKNEVEIYGKQHDFEVGRYPAIRRVQLLHLYFSWLKEDLNVMPQNRTFTWMFEQLEALAQPVRVDNVPEDLTWTCMRESRVRQRNSECAQLLAKMATHKFIEEYRACRNAKIKLRSLADWQIEYAGCIAFDPYNSRWMKDHSAIIPSVNTSVKKDHPLYVLRRENGKLILKRALVPSKNGSTWAVQTGMTKELLPGDPLFQVSTKGTCIDAEQTIRGMLTDIPVNMTKQFAPKIPFFQLEEN